MEELECSFYSAVYNLPQNVPRRYGWYTDNLTATQPLKHPPVGFKAAVSPFHLYFFFYLDTSLWPSLNFNRRPLKVFAATTPRKKLLSCGFPALLTVSLSLLALCQAASELASTMVQEYQSPVRVYKHPFELIMAVSIGSGTSLFPQHLDLFISTRVNKLILAVFILLPFKRKTRPSAEKCLLL